MGFVDLKKIEAIKRLEEKTGKRLLIPLLDLYRASVPAALERCKILLAKKEYENLAAEAHSLKSSSGNLGADAVAEACGEIEFLIVEEGNFSQDQLIELLEIIEIYYFKIIDELKDVA